MIILRSHIGTDGIEERLSAKVEDGNIILKNEFRNPTGPWLPLAISGIVLTANWLSLMLAELWRINEM